MATITPTLTVSLSGAGLLTSLSKEVTWQYQNKIEQDFLIVDTDGLVAILTETEIDNWKVLVVESTSAFNLSITTAGGTILFAINGVFCMTPTDTFMGTVTNISISTASTTDITVKVRAYGESTT